MPSLPILKSPFATSHADLLRFFHKIELEWTRPLGEETVLDCGTAIVNPRLSAVREANGVLDAALMPGTSAAAAFDEVQRHFAAAGSVCRRCVLNPSASPDQAAPLIDHLLQRGYTKTARDVLHLPRLPQTAIAETAGLKIIPARAGFRQLRALTEENAANAPQVVEAALLHLDDPHFDALLALKDGVAVAFVGVLIVGELAGIQSLFVSPDFRRRGTGRTMMSRALEICVRSLSRHVLLSVNPTDESAVRLYGELGFEKIGECVSYAAPEE